MNMPEHDHPLSIEDLRAILRRDRTQQSLIKIMAVLLVVAAFAFAVVALNFSHSVHKVEVVSARNDCSREYTGILTRADRELATSGWLQVDRLGTALFNSVSVGEHASSADIAAFGQGSATLHDNVTKVLALPDIDVAINKGFTLEGVHHPPCPQVK